MGGPAGRGPRARDLRGRSGRRPTSPPPRRRRSSWPSSGRRSAGARRRSMPGGGPSTSRSTSSRGNRPTHRPTTSSCATEAMRSRSGSGGGRGTRGTTGRPSSPSPTRRPTASRRRTSAPPPARWDAKLGEYVLAVGGDPRRPRSARARAGVRPFGLPPRLLGLRLGPGAGGHRGGRAASDQVTEAQPAGAAARSAERPAGIRRRSITTVVPLPGARVMLRGFTLSGRGSGALSSVRSMIAPSTIRISYSAKLAPMQRRTPPPKGIQE